MLRISFAVSMPFNSGMMMSRKIRSTGIVRRAVNRSSPLEYGYRVSERLFFSAQCVRSELNSRVKSISSSQIAIFIIFIKTFL